MFWLSVKICLSINQELNKEAIMRILFIENNEYFGDAIKAYLRKEGYTVDWFRDRNSANAILYTQETFDLVIMDLEVPGWNWQKWLDTFREKYSVVPILMISGLDVLAEGLDAGVDVYLPKSQVTGTTLLSNARALIRRSSAMTTAVTRSVLRYKNLELDTNTREAYIDGKTVVLTRIEYALLYKLLINIGQVITQGSLTQSLYGWDKQIDSNAVQVHIHNLRHKLKANYIKTVRGLGYKIVKDLKQHQAKDSVPATAAVNPSILRYKNLELDINAREVCVGRGKIRLSHREYTLLHKLLTNIGRVVTQNCLVQSLNSCGEPTDSTDPQIDIHIYNLRHKLEANYIKLIPGVGYTIIKD